MADRADAEDPGIPAEDTAGRAHSFFISYASHDTEVAQSICSSLEAAGFHCWIAPRDVKAGAQYADAIVAAINQAKVLVLVLSGSAVASSHVSREVERAASKRKSIIAFRIDNAPLSRALEYFLGESQWIDVPALGMPAALAKLAEAVAQEPSSAGLQAKAPKLRGRNSRIAIVVTIVAGVGTAVALGLHLWGFRTINHPSAVAAAPAANAPVSVPISDKSIAVLPFVDMSQKKDQEYFADGMAEEIIDMLAKVPDLHVPARTSSFYFKDKSTKIPDIAHELNVANVLEGSVRKSGDRLRVTAQLVRADTGYHLWSQTYDRKIEDVFTIQDQIAASVVQALKVSLLDGTNPKSTPTQSTEAYTLFLQAESIMRRSVTQADFEKLIDYAKKVITLDSKFSPGWALLSDIYAQQGYFEYVPRPIAYENARRAAAQALEFGPNVPEAHTAMAKVLLRYDYDFGDARTHIDQALRLDPNNLSALVWASQLAKSAGQINQSIEYDQARVARDPIQPSPYYSLARTQWWAGNIPAAQTAIDKALDLDPDFPGAHSRKGMILLAEGNPEGAIVEVNRERFYQSRLSSLAFVYPALGRQGDADEALAEYERKYATLDPNGVAAMYSARGEPDKAFEWLERAYNARDADLIDLKVDPRFNSLRADARYQAFLRKMKWSE
jgi:TolB-like protein/Flp pilus assembly protein TadD